MGTPPKELFEEHGSYGDWFLQAVEPMETNVIFEKIDVSKTSPDTMSRADAVILTGAHEGVYDELPWRDRFDPLMGKYIETGKHVLGICFSHQYLGELMGGKVEYRPENEEEGNITVTLTDEGKRDPLFTGVDRDADFLAAHSDMVVKPGPGAIHLAANDQVPFQSFRYGDNVRSCQFHPEMSEDISRSIIRTNEATDERKASWLKSLDKPHTGAIVMRNFLNIVHGQNL